MLEVRNLAKAYGETKALKNVSVDFRPGTIHAVLGENGSGKSTLVKILSGVIAPSSGEVLLDGVALVNFTPGAMQVKGIATVFQEVLVATDRSVVDNILLGSDGLFRRNVPRGERRASAKAALDRITRTPIDLDTTAGPLPLAVKQLIVIARALAKGPRVLIMDEITAALDFADRETVFDTMQQFAKRGGIIIFITHRMNEVMRLAERITVLRSGELVSTVARSEATAKDVLAMMAPMIARELADDA